MEELQRFIAILEATKLLPITRAILLLLAGYFLGRLLSAAVIKVLHKRLTAHGHLILKRVVLYGVFILLAISALRQLGFDLSVVLGAAGILTVAIGFASQTSASNVISGIFLMAERPFSIADVIRVGGVTGEVISIDLLSVKLRTFENLFVRIPNETMIKTEVTTLTKYPIRRADLLVGIAYKEDIETVREILMDLANQNPLCLVEPAPLFIVQGFGASSIDLQFSVWAKRENFLTLKNSFYEAIKKTFDEKGIEIPFPHVTLYAGAQTADFPVVNKPAKTNDQPAVDPSGINYGG